MRLVSLYARGCKRLRLSNVRSILISPKEAVQIILGTNGSGKSTIIRLMTPLAPDHNAFDKEGELITTWIKNGSTYVCRSIFTPKATHSFVQDGIEYNEGGTAGVQNELVKKHFGITPMIHDLMTGDEKFHQMGPLRRRIWFTLLCDVNYDFAMEAYNTIKERHNHITGALKMNSKNLVVETAKIISKEDEARLEEDVKLLLEELNTLMAERSPMERSVQSRANSRDEALKELEALSMRLLRTRAVAPLEYTGGKMVRDEWGQLKRASFNSLPEVDAEIDRLKHSITAKEATVTQSTEQYNKLHNDYEILLKAGKDGVHTLTEQHHTLELESFELINKMKYEISSPVAAREAFESIESSLVELLNNLPLNADRRLGKERLRTLQEQLVMLEDKRQALSVSLQRLAAKRDHADEHRNSGKATCPQCTHSFVVGIHEDQYKLLIEHIGQGNLQMDALMKERAKLMDDIREIELYFMQYREYVGFTRNVTILEPLWTALTSSGLITDAPKEAVQEVRVFKRDLDDAVKAEQIRLKMVEISKLREAAEQVGDANIQDVKERLDTLTAQLGEMTGQITGLHHAVAEYSDYRRQIANGLAMAEQIKSLYGRVHVLQDDFVEATRIESILHCIRQVQQSLAMKEESLRHIKMQKGIVDNLAAQVERLNGEELAAKMMVQALSPTKGLIAEGLLGFIRNFVGQMNTFIKGVWVYPLRIVPTGYTEGETSAELDYKFKMLVGPQSEPVKDVGLGSEGQREIVDLAFKTTAIHYLKLAAAPLFLDEFGAKLDEAHRFAATEAIKKLMAHRDFSQLFMISHYSEVYDGFANSEICVLSRDNITLRSDKVYNTHVVMTY